MLEEIFKAVMTAIPVLLTCLGSYLNHRQHTGKHNVTLREMLSREMAKSPPCAYQIESCVAELHRIKPLSSEFLLLVLPRSHALEIIQLVSTGRRALDLFDISVIDGRPHVRYTPAFSTFRKRAMTMAVCFIISAFFMINFSVFYWDFLDRVLGSSFPALLQEGLTGTQLYKLAVMTVSLAAGYVFLRQGITLKRSGECLRQIHSLIAASFPPPAAGR